MAEDFNLTVGDSVSLNILGREITGEIANTREVSWESFRINFVFVMSPGLLEKLHTAGLPQQNLIQMTPHQKIEQIVTSSFKNISASICGRMSNSRGGSGPSRQCY